MSLRSRGERTWFLIVVAIVAVLLAVFMAAGSGARAAPAWSFEIGKEFAPDVALYAAGRVNLPLGEIPFVGTQFWLLPEVGLTLTNPMKSYIRLQVMADTPYFAVGADVKPNAWGRVFVRFNL
jgi:hypothetical protein